MFSCYEIKEITLYNNMSFVTIFITYIKFNIKMSYLLITQKLYLTKLYIPI